VTKSDRNFILELGGKPALERLQETATAASDEERELMRRGLQIGCVVDETRLEFGRGDFLVRGVVGADQRSGAIAVGDNVPVGRTVQFQVRDADSADEDLRDLLTAADADAALLFTCNGRGQRLFGEADHDAGVVESLLGPLPLAGCFCAGELGPVGARNFLHGFTASLALFTS
jgi:small ligand-binding sensory domain FIST